MMRALIAVNLGRDPVEDHHSAAAAAELLDISEWIDDYAVERTRDEQVVVLFDADLPDVMRVMTSAWHLVRGSALEGVELIVSGTRPTGDIRATFGTIPQPAPGAWPQSAEDVEGVDDFEEMFGEYPEDTLMMC